MKGDRRHPWSLAVPLAVFILALVLLMAAAVWATLPSKSSPRGPECGPVQLTSPPGVSGQSITRKGKVWSLRVNPRNGRAVAIFSITDRDLLACGDFLELGQAETKLGYKASVFLEKRDNSFEVVPIWPQLIGSPVLNLRNAFTTKLDDAVALGLAIEPIDRRPEQSAGSQAAFTTLSPRLHPGSLTLQYRELLTEWFEAVAWTGISIHVVEHQIGKLKAYFRLNFLVGTALAIAILTAWLLFGKRPRLMIVAIVFPTLLAWAVLDIRWQHRLLHQLLESQFLYQESSETNILADPQDRALFEVAEMVRRYVPAEGPRVFISTGSEFAQKRLYYHLLPIRAVWKRPSRTFPPVSQGEQEFIGDFIVMTADSPVNFNSEAGLSRNGVSLGIPVVRVANSTQAVLLKIVGPESGH